MKKLRNVRSNWEFVAWYLIDPLIKNEKNRRFTRVQIMRKNYDEIYLILLACGHKRNPGHPEETIQRTLQNMRDKNWIRFFGQGEYELTEDGYKELLKNKENIAVVRSITPEEKRQLVKLMDNLKNKPS